MVDVQIDGRYIKELGSINHLYNNNDHVCRSYHDCISIVNQEPNFFGRSIRENLTYGLRTQLSDEQIMEAAKVANAHEFIQSFRAGLDTQVKH